MSGCNRGVSYVLTTSALHFPPRFAHWLTSLLLQLLRSGLRRSHSGSSVKWHSWLVQLQGNWQNQLDMMQWVVWRTQPGFDTSLHLILSWGTLHLGFSEVSINWQFLSWACKEQKSRSSRKETMYARTFGGKRPKQGILDTCGDEIFEWEGYIILTPPSHVCNPVSHGASSVAAPSSWSFRCDRQNDPKSEIKTSASLLTKVGWIRQTYPLTDRAYWSATGLTKLGEQIPKQKASGRDWLYHGLAHLLRSGKSLTWRGRECGTGGFPSTEVPPHRNWKQKERKSQPPTFLRMQTLALESDGEHVLPCWCSSQENAQTPFKATVCLRQKPLLNHDVILSPWNCS